MGSMGIPDVWAPGFHNEKNVFFNGFLEVFLIFLVDVGAKINHLGHLRWQQDGFGADIFWKFLVEDDATSFMFLPLRFRNMKMSSSSKKVMFWNFMKMFWKIMFQNRGPFEVFIKMWPVLRGSWNPLWIPPCLVHVLPFFVIFWRKNSKKNTRYYGRIPPPFLAFFLTSQKRDFARSDLRDVADVAGCIGVAGDIRANPTAKMSFSWAIYVGVVFWGYEGNNVFFLEILLALGRFTWGSSTFLLWNCAERVSKKTWRMRFRAGPKGRPVTSPKMLVFVVNVGSSLGNVGEKGDFLGSKSSLQEIITCFFSDNNVFFPVWYVGLYRRFLGKKSDF